MKLTSHRLLRLILANREASLEKLSPAIDKKYGDYRDYFPLSCLIISGYVAYDIRNSSGKINDERLLASILYAKASGKKKVNNYNNLSGTKGLYQQDFTMTAKTQIYFDELKAKRNEKVFTALLSIIVGVSSALITLTIKSKV